MRQTRGIIGILYIIAFSLLAFIIIGTLAYAKFHKPPADETASPSPTLMATSSPSNSPSPNNAATPSPAATASPTPTPSPTPSPTTPITVSGMNIHQVSANYTNGNHHIIIYGAGFQSSATVTLTGNGQNYSLQNIQSSPSQIEGDLPAGMSVGAYDITIKNPDNTQATLSSGLQITN